MMIAAVTTASNVDLALEERVRVRVAANAERRKAMLATAALKMSSTKSRRQCDVVDSNGAGRQHEATVNNESIEIIHMLTGGSNADQRAADHHLDVSDRNVVDLRASARAARAAQETRVAERIASGERQSHPSLPAAVSTTSRPHAARLAALQARPAPVSVALSWQSLSSSTKSAAGADSGDDAERHRIRNLVASLSTQDDALAAKVRRTATSLHVESERRRRLQELENAARRDEAERRVVQQLAASAAECERMRRIAMHNAGQCEDASMRQLNRVTVASAMANELVARVSEVHLSSRDAAEVRRQAQRHAHAEAERERDSRMFELAAGEHSSQHATAERAIALMRIVRDVESERSHQVARREAERIGESATEYERRAVSRATAVAVIEAERVRRTQLGFSQCADDFVRQSRVQAAAAAEQERERRLREMHVAHMAEQRDADLQRALNRRAAAADAADERVRLIAERQSALDAECMALQTQKQQQRAAARSVMEAERERRVADERKRREEDEHECRRVLVADLAGAGLKSSLLNVRSVEGGAAKRAAALTAFEHERASRISAYEERQHIESAAAAELRRELRVRAAEAFESTRAQAIETWTRRVSRASLVHSSPQVADESGNESDLECCGDDEGSAERSEQRRIALLADTRRAIVERRNLVCFIEVAAAAAAAALSLRNDASVSPPPLAVDTHSPEPVSPLAATAAAVRLHRVFARQLSSRSQLSKTLRAALRSSDVEHVERALCVFHAHHESEMGSAIGGGGNDNDDDDDSLALTAAEFELGRRCERLLTRLRVERDVAIDQLREALIARTTVHLERAIAVASAVRHPSVEIQRLACFARDELANVNASMPERDRLRRAAFEMREALIEHSLLSLGAAVAIGDQCEHIQPRVENALALAHVRELRAAAASELDVLQRAVAHGTATLQKLLAARPRSIEALERAARSLGTAPVSPQFDEMRAEALDTGRRLRAERAHGEHTLNAAVVARCANLIERALNNHVESPSPTFAHRVAAAKTLLAALCLEDQRRQQLH